MNTSVSESILFTVKEDLAVAEGPREVLETKYGKERVAPHPFLCEWGWVVLELADLTELQEAA